MTKVAGEVSMTLVEHLAELRSRIIKSLGAVVVFAIVITVFYDPVLRFLTHPYRTVVPALHDRERKYARYFLVAAVGLFALGSAIAYWTLTKALEFLISWSGEDVSQSYQISKYISLVSLMMLAFGLGLLFPLLLVFLQLANVLTPQTLVKQWRYAVMSIFVIAAVITPSGDPFSLFALAIPMTLLYIVSVIVGLLIQRGRRKREQSAI